MKMVGITAFGGYLPRLRLSRKAIVEANAWRDPSLRSRAAGERTMCSWDEDAVTMAVEAARDALRGRRPEEIGSLVFASTSAPFDDRQNSAIVAQVLGLAGPGGTMDVAGSQRAGTTALIGACDRVLARGGAALLVAAEKRRSPAGSVQELTSGDGAAAVVIGEGEVLARLVGSSSAAVDFVDHYRGHGREFDYQWEERWVRDEGYLKIVPPVIAALLRDTGTDAASVTHLCLPCTLPRVPEQIATGLGIPDAAVRDQLAAGCGNTGAAHAIVMLVHALETARPGDRILVAGFGQGCDALLFEVTPAIAGRPADATAIGRSLAGGRSTANYPKYLAFNELVQLEKGLRSELDKQTPLTTLYRNRDMLMSLVGGRCEKCGTIQFPKSGICVEPACGARHSQVPQPFADFHGRVMSWSADFLTYTPEPPAHYGMIEFAEGGRLLADFTDVEAGEVEVGQPMRMVFRIHEHDALRGFTRYFWKGAPDLTKGAR